MTELSDTVMNAVTTYTHVYGPALRADIISGSNAVRVSLAHPERPGDHYDITLPTKDPSATAARIETILRQRDDITLTSLLTYQSA